MRIVIADDNLLVRRGIAALLEEAGIDVAAQAGDMDELVAAVDAAPPDVAIVDIRMPPTHTDEGLRAAARIRAEHPGIAILVLSAYIAEAYVPDLLDAAPGGGVGYLLKDRVGHVREFLDSLDRVARGETVVDPQVVRQLLGRRRDSGPLATLTEREREVLALMAEGMSNAAIARRIVVSEGAVEKHVRNIFTKLDLPPDEDMNRRVLAVLTYLRT